MLPNLCRTNKCTLNSHYFTHLSKFVRLWGPLWTHSLFGYESFDGQSCLGCRVAEQLAFALDMCHTIGSLANKLAETESDNTIKFMSHMSSSISQQHRNMMSIFLGILLYRKNVVFWLPKREKSFTINIGTFLEHLYTFHKIYYNEVVFILFIVMRENETVQFVLTIAKVKLVIEFYISLV